MMAFSSAGSACNNGAFPGSTTAFNVEEFDSCQFEQRDDAQVRFVSNLNILSSSGSQSFGQLSSPVGEEGNGFDFMPDTSIRHLGETQYLDPYAFDYYLGGQQGLGPDPGSMMANPDLGLFMQHESTNVDSLVGLESSPVVSPNRNVTSSSAGLQSQAVGLSTFGPAVQGIVGCVAIQGQNGAASPMSSVLSDASSFSECDSIVPHYSEDSSIVRPQSNPSQNLPDSVNLVKTQNMTVPNVTTEELRITRQQMETSNKVAEVLACHSSPAFSAITLKSQAPKHLKTPQRHTVRDRNSRTRNVAEKPKANGKATKAKTKALTNVWHVMTALTPEVRPSAASPATGQIPMMSVAPPSVRDADAEVNSSASNSAIVSKGPGRRKEIFQLVDPAKTEKQGKPEWCVPPPRKIHEKLLKPQPMNNRLEPGTHSDVGWVIARLREPNHGRTQFGWAIAQIHDPRLSSYLILSGPHLFKIKTVRGYDRIPYSETNIDKLKERVQNKKAGARCDKVYGTVYPNSDEIARRSSAFATMHAAGEFFVN